MSQVKLKPVELGKDVAAVEAAGEAVARAAAVYRIFPNYPNCQEQKATYWTEYQRCVAHFMEVAGRV